MSDRARIVLGCEQLGGTDWGIVDRNDVEATVRTAWDIGIRAFDTADVYGLGESERRLADALGPHRHEAYIISKFGIRWDERAVNQRAKTYRDSSPSYLRSAIEASLARLRVDRIAVYLVHWPDPLTPLEETLGVLNDLVTEGKIGGFGVSNFYGGQLRAAAFVVGCRVVQLPLNLIDRGAESDLEFCHSEGLMTMAYGPLAQGFLSGNYGPGSAFDEDDRRHRLPVFSSEASWTERLALLRRLEAVATGCGISLAGAAVRWVLTKPYVDRVVVGAKRPSQLIDVVDALELEVDPTATYSLGAL